jgi:competence protein ComEC
MNKKWRSVAVLLLFGLASCGRAVNPGLHPLASVAFLDVGQGDAALIRTVAGKTILIDAGSNDCGSDTLLANRGVIRIDDLILSHPHEDHYGNMRRILERFPVQRVLFNRTACSGAIDPDFRRLLSCITDSLGLDTMILSAGKVIQEDSVSSILCLWPDTAPLSPDIDDTVNALSLVLQVRLGAASLLFTGDINFNVEKRVVEFPCLGSAILKVAHHGSKNATSHAFLAAISPLISIVSVGANNDYGHPEEELLARLNFSGGRVFRTDKNGTVSFWLDTEGNVLAHGNQEN